MQRKWLIAGGVGVAALGAAFWFGREPFLLATYGTAYAAKQTCSCLHLSARALESCKGDYPPEVSGLFAWKVKDNAVTVTALGGVFSATATHEDGFGCQLVK
jgi:hypothetical protein